MLIACGGTRFGSATMRSKMLLERRFWAHLVERDDLVFDARFVPGAAGRSSNRIVYLLLRGTFEVLAPIRARFEGPVAFVLDEGQFEGAGGRRSFLFRSTGHPLTAFELRLAPDEVIFDAPTTPAELPSDTRTWSAVRRLADLDGSDAARITESVIEILGALGALGVVRSDLAGSVADGDARFARVWAAVRPMAERFHVMPTLEELSSASGLSLRQIAREVTAFMGAFRLMESGWRAATRRFRLKVAVLGLSAPHATVAEAARAAGYGSSDAMARAFRDAGLPPPLAVQASLRAV